MAALTPRQPRAAGSVSGNQPQVRVYDVAAGATLRVGDVIVSSAGKAALAASPVLANDTVLGVALNAALQGTEWYLGDNSKQENSGGTFGGTFMGSADLLESVEGIGEHVALANADNLFEISLLEALALTQLGSSVGILKDGNGIWYASTAEATKVAAIVAIPNRPDQAIGDTYARVIVQFLSAASALF